MRDLRSPSPRQQREAADDLVRRGRRGAAASPRGLGLVGRLAEIAPSSATTVSTPRTAHRRGRRRRDRARLAAARSRGRRRSTRGRSRRAAAPRRRSRSTSNATPSCSGSPAAAASATRGRASASARLGKKIATSRAADSGESEPWTRFWPTSSAKSPRIEPVAASSGFVAPITWRAARRPRALEDHRDERAGGDEVDELAEERLALVLGVVLSAVSRVERHAA